MRLGDILEWVLDQASTRPGDIIKFGLGLYRIVAFKTVNGDRPGEFKIVLTVRAES